MIRAFGRFRRWRIGRLRRRVHFLEEKLELYRRFAHQVGFETLERIASEERKLRRLQFAIGLHELRERVASGSPALARAYDAAAR